MSLGETSLSTVFNGLPLRSSSRVIAEGDSERPSLSRVGSPAPKAEIRIISEDGVPKTPSHIPKLIPPPVVPPTEAPSPSKVSKKTPKALPKYLNRDTNVTLAWDTDSRLMEMENSISQFKEKMDGATTESRSLKEMMAVYKIRSTC